jgi:hypothetical protein
MRLTTILASAAALAVLAATPAAAANFVAQAGVNANVFANAACSQSTANVTGNSPVSAENTCTNSDVGTGHARSFASFGHLGVAADMASHNGDSLGAGASGQADFTDFVTFTQTNGTVAATTDVAVNLVLDGLFGAAGNAQAGIEGFLIFNGQFFGFRFETSSDGTTGARNSFISTGDIFSQHSVALRTPLINVALNSPIQFRLHLEDGVGGGGPASSAFADFGEHSFKLPTGGPAFGLADGFTANAGDWLVDNRFIDPLAPANGVPEPATWALLIAGLGLVGAALRRGRMILEI